MKKILAVTGTFLIACIIISSYAGKNVSGAGDGEIIADNNVNEISQTAQDGYIISEFSGRVALYRESDGKILFSTDTLVKDLPKADQESLKKGIVVSTRKEAEQYLNDLCS